MSSIKVEAIKPKRAGGRPPSEGWSLYGFEKVEGDKGKSLARCMKCVNTLQNTSLSRMRNHYNRCSTMNGPSSSREVKKVYEKVEVGDDIEVIASNTVVWEATEGDHLDDYVDESVPVEKISQTAIEIVSEDIKRHRKTLSAPPKVRNHSIDAALSSFIIGCNLTFDVVDLPHFKSFVKALNPNYIMPSSTQLKARVISQLQNVDGSEKKSAKKRRYYQSSDDDSN